jgi:hypothetical protein
MRCDECKFCVLEDYGYSNWTVEGTNVSCVLNLNPKFPADHRWGHSPEAEFAKECSRYTKGDPVEVDVDQDLGHFLNYVDDDEVREIVEKEIMWGALKNENN